MEEVHFKLLEANPQVTQRELSAVLGVSLGKANYSFKALIARDWVKVGNLRASPNKLACAYLLTPKGLAAKRRLTVKFLKRKFSEYETLRREFAELEAESERLYRAGAEE